MPYTPLLVLSLYRRRGAPPTLYYFASFFIYLRYVLVSVLFYTCYDGGLQIFGYEGFLGAELLFVGSHYRRQGTPLPFNWIRILYLFQICYSYSFFF